jgi:hypothetical protein
MVLNANNLTEEQIQKLVKLELISPEQAKNAVRKPSIASIVASSRNNNLKKWHNSVHNGPFPTHSFKTRKS